MIYDHYSERWGGTLPYAPNGNYPVTTWPPPGPTPQEVEEFRKLLERAREYDKKNNEPDCELAEKKAALKKIADSLGIDISFIDKP